MGSVMDWMFVSSPSYVDDALILDVMVSVGGVQGR